MALYGDFLDFNPVFDQIVIAQGTDVQPGTAYAADWGSFAYGGTTGGAPPYGYRHLHQLYSLADTPKNKAVRAIIAMCCQRHVAYFGPDAVIRKDGYDFAMRPYGTALNKLTYVPITSNDAIGGGTNWPDPINANNWIEWHNWDSQHAWSFLPDVVKLKNVTIPFLPGVSGYETINAASLALARLIVETFGIVGMVTNPYYLGLHLAVNDWSDRLSARMLQWPIDAWRVGALDTSLNNAYLAFIQAMVTFYKTAPGCSLIDKNLTAVPPYVFGDIYFQPHNLSQVGAAMYDIANALNGTVLSSLQTDLRNICKRIGQCVADCIDTGGAHPGVLPFGVKLTGTALGSGGVPVSELASHFASGAAVRFYETFDDTPWGYRGLHCAGVLGVTSAATKAATMLASYQGTASFWSYLVNADYSYAVAAAKAAAGE